MEHLASEIGERNLKQHWELASAVDYLSAELEQAGYTVVREGYALEDESVVQNLVAEHRGGRRGNEVVVVGAHYDSPLGSPGASDATGVAALLSLARSLRGFETLRTVRFVLFGLSHAPHARTPTMASLVYAQKLAAAHTEVSAMVGLESLGYFSTAAGSQHAPAGLEGTYPDVGDFVSFVGDPRADEILDGMQRIFASEASIGARTALLVEPTDGLGGSDSWGFAQAGFAALSVTDTGPLRDVRCGTPDDKPDAIDFERAARVVAGLEVAIRKLAGADQPLPAPESLTETPGAP